jgi:hypothetical protein
MYAQDISDNNYLNDEYHIFGGMAEGITIYEGRPRDFAPESIEGSILHALNGSLADRKNIIENELLGNAGFRRTGNLKYRKTEPSEKAMSVLHGAAHAFSFGIIPMKPFFEIDYARLPDGVYYSFNSVISSSELIDISPEILSVVEIEYMLQIEFCNGILIKNNINYYSEKNINKFEKLILNLPEYPESIRQLKERYLNIELPKIRRSLYRYNNPSEDYLRALENLGGSFNINKKK